MSKRLYRYIASFDYLDKLLTVSPVTTGITSVASIATISAAPVRKASASFRFSSSISTGIVKRLLRRTRNNKKKHNKFNILARRKLNSIDSKISDALITNEFSYEDFMTIINEERNYRELKESITIMNSQRNDTEKIYLIEQDKKICIHEIIKRNGIINKQFKTRSYYCLKSIKNTTKNMNPIVSKTINDKILLLSKCAVYDSKKSRFIKKTRSKGNHK